MNCYSGKLTTKQEKELKKRLETDGFEFASVQNALWSAKGSAVSVTYYKSTKLLVQGKECEAFVGKYLKPLGQLSLGVNLAAENTEHCFTSWIGTDESGKGDYFGPLVTAGVLVDREQIAVLSEFQIQDSKKISDSMIVKIAPKIKKHCVFSVVVISPEKYNQLYDSFKNLNKLLAWSHARAIENILEKKDCQNVISDKFGDENLIKNALFKKGKTINLIQRTKAESDIAVAAASILAREEYLNRMKQLGFAYKMEFLKGGNEKVDEQAREFVRKYGAQKLNTVAKLHFKNTQRVI
ncbi:MAG: ribonuclease HIII [Candidatus Gastranaerophilales bacterium]|nr:ribonuclease HIII [Candidatus Gastranaerophilales bacterium]